jgi:hypothetical protein
MQLADTDRDSKVSFKEFCEAVHWKKKFKTERKTYLISVPHWGEIYRLSQLNKEKP